MKFFATLLLITLSNGFGFANDGSFYAKGNQLIPVFETDIKSGINLLR
jgi:hypothetical protein